MNTVDTSDALDLTKENIRPLKQGRKPIQLEAALQAQSNSEIQQQLNKDKEKFEHAIRTYEGEDPLAPRFEYVKWLEQIYLKHGPESNLMPLIEETVQRFKNDPKYKQDPRFIQILINFIENQTNAIELYQTVYNQGIGTMCAIFYRAWADLLDRYNDFKRVDQIFLLGINAKAEPVEELEQAHLQFQLSVARRLLNGQLSNDEDKNSELGKRQAFSVLKSSETRSGIRHGLGGIVGKVPQVNNVNGKSSTLRIFEDNDENGLIGIDGNNCDLAQNGLNKENTVKPGPWSKPKKSRSKFVKPVSSINFEVHQDNNVERVTKLPGITVPNALRSIKGSSNISCPVAVFEPPDPTKKPMYCKDKVYAAGRDVQLEEIRYEVFLKQEKDKQKGACSFNCVIKSPTKENAIKPLKKVIIPDDNKNANNVKAPHPLLTESDPLSQSVTVNTRAAIDLVQQMWNSPCSDKDEENKLIPKEAKTINDFYIYTDDDDNAKMCKQNAFVDNNVQNQVKNIKIPEVYVDDNDENQIKNIRIPEVYIDKNIENHVKTNKITEVYIDDDDENQVKNIKIPEVYVDDNDENQLKNIKIPKVYVDNDDENQINNVKLPEVYNDENNAHSFKNFKTPDVNMNNSKMLKKLNTKKNDIMHVSKDTGSNNIAKSKILNYEKNKQCIKAQNYQVYEDESENDDEIKMNQIKEITNNMSNSLSTLKNNQDDVNDDMTCSTKAFAFILTSSTPLAPGRTKPSCVPENKKQPLILVEEKENDENEEFKSGKSLSMILEASKERNSSSSSGIISKLEHPSTIDFGDSINPFDDELITKLLRKVIKFPNERHLSGYREYKSDMPCMRSEFKLGDSKMLFLGEIGKGSYARVVRTRTADKNSEQRALKIQKPSCTWEWYISKEIQHRLKDSEKICYFINMDNMYLFKNGSIISMEFSIYGTILSVVLAHKAAFNQSIPVPIAALLVSQITSAVKYLHQCQIIHGDLKPDNVILKSLPNQSFLPCVQLIDFGRSIDMTLFPPDTSFTYAVKTVDFVCHEMREKLPWTYQTDYYGLAGIIYMILKADYMKTHKIHKEWVILKALPRYIDKTMWGDILKTLLNIESCKNLPNLDSIVERLNKYLSIQQTVVLNNHFTSFKKVLLKNSKHL